MRELRRIGAGSHFNKAMDETLKGKNALITGASSGIGRAISLQLAKAGVNCVLAARRQGALEALAQEIEEYEVRTMVVPTDVTNEAEREALLETIGNEWGELHILINNAGIFKMSSVDDLQLDSLEQTLAVNLIAPMMLAKLSLYLLRQNEHSAIINIASISGTMGFAKGSAYSASKFGIMGFSESLFEEVREQGVKVCAICPGYVNTEMVAGHGLDEAKMIQPEDIASTVVHVLEMPVQSCPSKIIIRPQFSPVK